MSKVVEITEEKGTVITLKPIVRQGWLPKGHDGEFQFTGCETWKVPTKSSQTGQRQTGLTPEDEARLERKLKLAAGSLSKYNEDFWSNYKIKIPKEGRIFYMENPKDELDVLILKAHPDIANSAMEVADSPGASHYLSSLEKEAEVNNAKDKSEREAIKLYAGLGTDEKIDVLKVYGLLGGRSSIKITKNTSVDLIESSLYEKLKNDPDEFIRIVKDPSFKTRVLIDSLIAKRILIRSGSKYIVHGGDAIGVNLEATIEYLEDPQNQDVLISLKGKLEASE